MFHMFDKEKKRLHDKNISFQEMHTPWANKG